MKLRDREMLQTLRRASAAASAIMALVSCAAPPTTLYRLGMPALPEHVAPLGPTPIVIAVDRVSLPDYLDTEDLLVRRGSSLHRSETGRWASRLSLGATALLTERLGRSRPDALVTDEPQTATPSDRLVINISRLDLSTDRDTSDGAATLEADWMIVPGEPASPTVRGRAQMTVRGSLGTDSAVVALTTAVLTRLSAAIDITRLR